MIRMPRNSYLIAAAAALVLPAAGFAKKPAPASPFVTVGSQADAPVGFVELCARDQLLCRAGMAAAGGANPQFQPTAATSPATGSGTADAVVFGTGATVTRKRLRAFRTIARDMNDVDGRELALLDAVNHAVNRQVVQMPDFISTGEEDEWVRPGVSGRPAGDCEDIALEKRMRLIEAGFPADRLFYSVVYKRNFGLHLILIARTGLGDVVLDSAQPDIMPWHKARYVWLRIQSPSDPMHWSRIGSISIAGRETKSVASAS
jgi:predicted transglutaminase-like cysteine proteinase